MRRIASIAVALLATLALAGAALADNAGLTPVEPESPNAEATAITFWIVLGVTGAVFLLVEVALIVFIVRYRRRGRPVDAEGPQIHGNTNLELIWTVVPVLLLAFIAGFVFWKLPEIQDVPEARAGGGENLHVTVDGRQFYWQFTYPDGSITYDKLIVPVDRVVELDITAEETDVIHSWWIPALGGKFDAIPGQTTSTWFRAKRKGEFEGNCAEYCGIQHGAMRMSVSVVGGAQWGELVNELAGNGREQFEAACAKCHNVQGPQLIGPTLSGNPLLADAEGLGELVRNGRNEMPAVGRGWTDEQIETLVEYTRRLAEGGQ